MGWPDLAAPPVMPEPRIRRRPAPAGLSGVWVEDKAWGMSYVLAALDGDHVRTGGALGSDGLKWAAIEKELPSTTGRDDGGSSLTADFSIEPGTTTHCFIRRPPIAMKGAAPGSARNFSISAVPRRRIILSRTRPADMFPFTKVAG